MAKKTLLQMVQNILSAMDSDEVNSISDTVESLQVAEIVRETYEDLTATLSIPERRALVRLEGVADVLRPNYLKIPDTVKDITWIRYNNTELTYKSPEEFVNYVLSIEGDITVTDFNDVTYTVRNDRDPVYWTCFDDEHLVFDALNQSLESTLQESNSLAYAELNNIFQMEDDFVADLDDNMFPLFLSEAKATCFINLKQVSNAKEEQRARRQLVRVQNEFNRTATKNPIDRLPNYGRRR
jgi:hypothetical protein